MKTSDNAKRSWFRRFIEKRIPNIEDIFDVVLPYGTQILHKNNRKQAESLYAQLLQMIGNNDIVYKTLSELGFAEKTEDLKLVTAIARGKIAPDVVDKDSVEVDANIWMQDRLLPIQHLFANWDLAGEIEVIPEYDAQRDIVYFYMQPINLFESEQMALLLDANKFITKIWNLLFACCVIFMLQIIGIALYYLFN